MFKSPADRWNRVRETFAEQFEQTGTNFVYRRSQKGEAISVSAEERRKFIDDFDRSVRRAKWIIYVGLTFALGVVALLAVLRGSDLSQATIFAGIGLVMIPYFAYYRWAWAAPARELAGRTPIAGERSSEEVRRLRFQRMTYGQLAGAAFGGLVIPFIGSSHQAVFSGWNRLWLVFGGALVLLAAVQAFRKWRFEQEDSYRNVIPPPSMRDITEPIEESAWRTKGRLRRYLFIGAVVLAVAFIAFTPAGKRLAQSPNFLPILIIGCGGWSLFTVAQGFAKGQIEPFARGFYNTYERETQPKRFWVSMIWNGLFGSFCLWVAVEMNGQELADAVQDRCYNEHAKHPPREMLSACNQMLDKKVHLDRWTRADVLLNRGIAYHRLRDPKQAIADNTEALRLQSDYFEAYYNRALAYDDLRDTRHAIEDYTAAIRLRPKDADAYFNRGLDYEKIGDLQNTIANFSEVLRLTPDRVDAYYYRWAAYKDLGNEEQAAADLAAIARLNPKAAAALRGNR